MPQKGKRDLAKERYWLGVIADWEASELSLAEYCRKQEVGYWKLQYWRRRLPRMNDAAAPSRPATGRKFKGSQKDKSVDFLPVRVVDELESEETRQPATVEVVLRCGIVVRLGSDCPPKFLSSVISVIERR